VLATTAGTAAEALDDGTALRASGRASAGWLRTFAGGADTGTIAADSTVRIRKNDQGGLDLITPNNGTFVFTAADLSPDGGGFRLPDGSAGIYAYNAAMLDALGADGVERYSLAFDYWYDYGDGDFSRNGYVVVGTETADSALRTNTTATYAGETQIYVAPSEGFDEWDTDVSEIYGDVTLTANFGSATVSGGVDGMHRREPNAVNPSGDWTPFDGSLTLGSANIVGNGFEGGAVTADADFAANVGTVGAGSSYAGTFFGPNAEEVGGGIILTGDANNLTGIPDGDTYIGQGYWQAERQ